MIIIFCFNDIPFMEKQLSKKKVFLIILKVYMIIVFFFRIHNKYKKQFIYRQVKKIKNSFKHSTYRYLVTYAFKYTKSYIFSTLNS